jgi:enterochelin esterase-like enzyme
VSPVETPATVTLVGRVDEHTYFSATSGGEEFYRIYLPPNYDQSERRYPVLYLLHGWPYEAAHWDGLGTEETADVNIQSGALPPFIIVQPKGTERLYINTSGGDHSFEGQVVNDLIPHIDATYRTWAAREGRAIGGISRGGVWALEIGFRYPDIFSIVGGHSPALSVNLAPPAHDPVYLLEDPRVATLRIYLDAGDADWAMEDTQELHETLSARGIPHQFAEHAGGHAAGLWTASVVEYLTFYTQEWFNAP